MYTDIKMNVNKKAKKNSSLTQAYPLILSLFLIFLLAIPYAFADIFDLTYTLTEGGYQLELNPANPYKGVRIEVISDIDTQYEITQEVISPLENKDSPGTFIRGNFVIRRISEGNANGTFYVQSSDLPVNSLDRIYTSNTEGAPVNFTLVYGVTNIGEITAGHYYGKIRFTLRPLGASIEQVSKFLDVYVTLAQEGEIKPKVEIATADGSKVISINSKREEQQACDVVFTVNGRFKNLFSLTQVLARPLESAEGNRLDYEAINCQTREVNKGMGMPLSPLSSVRQTFYTSGPDGSAPESFILTYSLGDLSKQKAGRYSSRIQYYLEETGKAPALLETLNLEIENERIFELLFSPEDQKSFIEFHDLKPNEPPKQDIIVIEIKTNVGKPYQVSQNVYSELTNSEGKVIPEKYFTVKTESMNTKGTLRLPVQQEVKRGDTVLFVSDDRGTPDKFKVIYELGIPSLIKGGDYSTKIVYSLSEL